MEPPPGRTIMERDSSPEDPDFSNVPNFRFDPMPQMLDIQPCSFMDSHHQAATQQDDSLFEWNELPPLDVSYPPAHPRRHILHMPSNSQGPFLVDSPEAPSELAQDLAEVLPFAPGPVSASSSSSHSYGFRVPKAQKRDIGETAGSVMTPTPAPASSASHRAASSNSTNSSSCAPHSSSSSASASASVDYATVSSDEGIAVAWEEARVFIESPPAAFVCQICADVLSEPQVLTLCGHTFCSHCVMQCLENKNQCPSCRKQYPTQARRRADLMVKNFTVESSIDDLKIHCKYGLMKTTDAVNSNEWIMDPRGCKEVIRLGNRRSHENRCGYARVTCGLMDKLKQEICKTECLRKDLAEHRLQCAFRLQSCLNEGCTQMIPARSLDAHKNECEHAEICCPNTACGANMKRREVATHLANICPEQAVECPWTKFGCKTNQKILRKDLSSHLVASTSDHMLRMTEYFETEMRRMRNTIEMIPTKCRVSWKLDKFPSLDLAYSRPFQFGGYKWTMHAEISENSTVGFFLTIGGIAKEEKLTVKTTFTLQPYNTSKTGTTVFCADRPSWGVHPWNVGRLLQTVTVLMEFVILEKSIITELAPAPQTRYRPSSSSQQTSLSSPNSSATSSINSSSRAVGVGSELGPASTTNASQGPSPSMSVSSLMHVQL